MRKYFIVFILLIPSLLKSQYWEVGVLGGISAYSGDLTQSVIDFKEIHPAGGAIVRYNVNQWYSIKANFLYGSMSGNDANSSVSNMKYRNLSFKSSLLDIGVQTEINLRGYWSGHPRYNSTPYLLFGASVFRFNPKAQYNGQWYELQPLGTEGQGSTKYNEREKYALTQISLPMGVGFKYALNRWWNVGFEFGYRYTFTDYLDDVSKTYVESDVLRGLNPMSPILANRTREKYQDVPDFSPLDDRGDPTKNDWYFFTGLTITYSILPNACYRFN